MLTSDSVTVADEKGNVNYRKVESVKIFLVAFSAAILGVVVGSFVSGSRPHVATHERVVTKELVLVDDQDKPAARMQYADGKTILTFYSADSTPALEVGIDRARTTQFVRFIDAGGTILASLNAVPSGDSTLYLAEKRRGTRVILGALLPDMYLGLPANDWGLVFRKPGSRQSLIRMVVGSTEKAADSTAGIYVYRPNGQAAWTVP